MNRRFKPGDRVQELDDALEGRVVGFRGGMVCLRTDDGLRPVTVVKVGGKFVDVDLNHPRAGLTLTFDLEVVEVRAATAEETAHRHVHGPGGHSH